MDSQDGNHKFHLRRLEVLDISKEHTFMKPVKRIHEGKDVPNFRISHGYTDIMIFVMQLNRAVCPRTTDATGNKNSVHTWTLDSPKVRISEPIKKLQDLLKRIDSIIDEVPPDTGPRRFGNISFRRFCEIFESRASVILDEFLPVDILSCGSSDVKAKDELLSYLLGGFGSAQRLDYGTGHELNFVAFLGCLWKLGFFRTDLEDDEQQRSIVLHIIEPYLKVIRRLILTYTLEPAGSHGVWGLDDHSFMPYIFGSAQYCPAISETESVPVEGSLVGSPSPGDVAKKETVERYRQSNMYFAAVGFINDVKTGPFWEHSPMLFDISGVQKGWAKINKGMLKMFDAEVLGKFPVVQHFPFGTLFRWDTNQEYLNEAMLHTRSHTSTQASICGGISATGNDKGAPTTRPAQESTKAPWASSSIPSRLTQEDTKVSNIPSQSIATTPAPWAISSGGMAPTRTAWEGSGTSSTGMLPPTTRAPWAAAGSNSSGARTSPPARAAWAEASGTNSTRSGGIDGEVATKTPWASKDK